MKERRAQWRSQDFISGGGITSKAVSLVCGPHQFVKISILHTHPAERAPFTCFFTEGFSFRDQKGPES